MNKVFSKRATSTIATKYLAYASSNTESVSVNDVFIVFSLLADNFLAILTNLTETSDYHIDSELESFIKIYKATAISVTIGNPPSKMDSIYDSKNVIYSKTYTIRS